VRGGDADVEAERAAVLALTDDETRDAAYTLVVRRLRKVYPAKGATALDTVAVHDASFRVAKGEAFGLLGANGAGKSTVLNAIIRAHAPTAGDILVAGHSVLDDFEHAAKTLGVVTQMNALWNLLSCRDHLRLFAQLRGVPHTEAAALVEAALDQLELRPHARKLAGRLSGGMKRKLCVAIAVIGDPELCLLDEPSAGLDPVSRRNLWNVLRSTMHARSVVLTSHLFPEVEALCDRVAIMVKGKLRVVGTIQHLKSSLGSNYELEIAAPAASEDAVHALVKGLIPDKFNADDAVQIASTAGGLLCYEVAKEAIDVATVFETLEARKDELHISDYAIAQPSLEAVFIKTVQKYDGDDEFARGLDFDEIEVDKEERMTGCTRIQHKRMAWICGVAAFICWFASAFNKYISTFLFVFFIAAVWGCVGCCCVLKPPPVEE